MTLTITRPAALLTTTGRELATLLCAVLPHVSQEEDEMPLLRGLHIEINGGDLRFIASDRYTMGIVRHPLTAVMGGFSCSIVIPGHAARSLADRLENDTAVSIRVEEDGVVIDGGEWLASIPADKSTLPWRAVLGRVLHPADTPTGRILLNPQYLARLAPAYELVEHAPMQIQMRGSEGAVIATLGARFLALVMPVGNRTWSGEEVPPRPLDPWFDLLDEETGEVQDALNRLPVREESRG